MTWFRVHNHAYVPFHVAIGTAGVIQYLTNDVPANGYTEFDVQDAIWHDLYVIVSNGQNQIDQTNHNILKAVEIGVEAIAGVGAAIGIVALWPIASGVSLGLAVAAAIGAEFAGLIAIAGSLGNYFLGPVSVSNLYAPYGYNFDITGGAVTGSVDPQTNTFTVTSIAPLMVKWHNNTNGAEGTVQAKNGSL
ncbi:MAG: hypothetical protein JO081_01340 [Alphaproteobacteria bacterium]|nr:hypothetical protein [Alphaproteobacteria bacterium]